MTTQITVRPLIRTVVAVEEKATLQECASGRRQEWRGRKTKTDGVRCQKPAMAAETETETETETVIKNLKGSRSVVERLCDILVVMIILLPLKLV